MTIILQGVLTEDARQILLFLQVGKLLLQVGHLIQTLHPPPLAVLIIHLCLHQHDKVYITSPVCLIHPHTLSHIFTLPAQNIH